MKNMNTVLLCKACHWCIQ